MKKLIAVFFFLINFPLYAQVRSREPLTMHKFVHVGYVYQNSGFGEVGGRILLLRHDDVAFRVGAAALMGSSNSEFAIMPKAQADVLFNFRRNVDFYHSWYFLAGAEATDKYIAPKAGFNIAGMLDITGGYGFAYKNQTLKGKKLEGLNIGLTLNMPIPLLVDLFK